MPRAIFLYVESTPGELASGTNLPDTSTILAGTHYALRPDRSPTDMGPGRTITPASADRGRSGRGASQGVRRGDYYTSGGTRYPKAGGVFSVEMEVCQPGSGVAWSTTPAWHILRSRYALDTPAIATDTVTGVSGLRLTPATPASWDTGDVAVVTINGHDYAFMVTGRTGDDLLIHPGLPSTLAGGTTVRLCHRLYPRPGSEGSTFAIIDHGPSTLWIGTHCRLGDHSFTRSGDGRLILRADLLVGTWVPSHSNADAWTALGASPVGGPARLDDIQWRVSSDYQGDGGSLLTSASHSSAAITGLTVESLEVAVAVNSETVAGIHLPTGVCSIKTGDVNATMTIGACDYSATFNYDSLRAGVRAQMLCCGPLGAGAGVVLGGAGWMLDPASLPDAVEPTLTRDKQMLTFLSTGDASPCDEAPGVGGYADANPASWFIGLVQ